MNYPVRAARWIPATGMALFPFILVKHPQLKKNKLLINHELIHIRQQVELLVIPFYLLYLLFYLLLLMYYRNHDSAYRNIPFEREAYANEKDFDYLKNRGFFSWMKY